MASDGIINSIVFWPEKIFAEQCTNEKWENYIPKSINLMDFIQKWLPGMEKDNLNITIFYTDNNKGIIIKPSELKRDIEDKLEQSN